MINAMVLRGFAQRTQWTLPFTRLQYAARLSLVAALAEKATG